jgi:membrane protein YdbS with pleckstrin-like domain
MSAFQPSMSAFEPAPPAITLSPSAVLYFALNRALRFVAFSCVCGLLLFVMFHGPIRGPFHGTQWGLIGGGALFVTGVFLVLLGAQLAYSYLLVNSYRIEMRNDGLSLRHGILSTNSEVLLFSKIQDIIINCNVLERMMGLATLTVQNAMGNPEVIPGLDADDAESLRDQIMSHVGRTSSS